MLYQSIVLVISKMDFGLNVVLFQILKLRVQQWNGNFICSILTEHLQNPEKEIRFHGNLHWQQPNLTEYLLN
jgi:hypothetical protein